MAPGSAQLGKAGVTCGFTTGWMSGNCVPEQMNDAAVPQSDAIQAPEHGPRLLFFSGGSALNGLGRCLKHHSHRTVHLVTPFDSGGSSAVLRQAFGMPAIGDLRSRLMALADDSVTGHPEIVALFQRRLPADAEPETLLHSLQRLADGSDAAVQAIPSPLGELICSLLSSFLSAMPSAFDLRGASIGNLILAGGYLNHGHALRPVIKVFSELIQVRGTVLPVVDDSLHLGVRLRDGREIIGQHRITGKEVAPLSSPVAELFLSQCPDEPRRVVPQINADIQALIADADLICFPPGSFFSSVLANLLPAGVGPAVAANAAPKVYVPNLGDDPEQLGYGVADCLQQLSHTLGRAGGQDAGMPDILLLDQQRDRYRGLPSAAQLRDWGVEQVESELVSATSGDYYDSELLARALVALA